MRFRRRGKSTKKLIIELAGLVNYLTFQGGSRNVFHFNFDQMDREQKLLTIRISGAHFSACAYDLRRQIFIKDSYRRVPHSRKATCEVSINNWRQVIESMQSKILKDVDFCAISAPSTALNDSTGNCFGAANYNDLQLDEVFAEILSLPDQNVEVYSNSTSFLRGALESMPNIEDDCVAGIEIGSDLSPALRCNSSIVDLNSLQNFRNCFSLEELTTTSLLKRYYEQTGISLLNVSDLTNLYNKHPTAKKTMREFCEQLSSFFASLKLLYPIKTLILGGDIIYPTELMYMLQRALGPVSLRIGNRLDFTTHIGMSLLFKETQVQLATL